jgi:hypothetical protein
MVREERTTITMETSETIVAVAAAAAAAVMVGCLTWGLKERRGQLTLAPVVAAAVAF